MMVVMESSTVEIKNESRAAKKPQQRTRILRTYGKRTASEPAQPALKKRRIDNINAAAASNDETAESPRAATDPPSPALPPAQPAIKGTIMSYFKAVRPSSSCALRSSPEPSSERIDPTSTPPSSPPVPSLQRKKRRRLTTRIISRAASVESKTEDGMEDDGGKGTFKEVDAGSVSPTKSPPALSKIPPATLNLPIAKPNKRQDTKKTSKSAIVQTTLSLSVEDKGFIECKQCNMLYNPLHKQDAKCHSRRHAAMVKAKLDNCDSNKPVD
ncbi:hypothetical protein F5Y11DRAFT_13825 [Daldinia sp. FL1419]|nr:hypothetical protein F5Y11DRAFT_13825 [Daldinia sp. FL1419]